MFVKEHADPVGQPRTIEAVEAMLQNYMLLWDQSKTVRSAWRRPDTSRVTNFIMRALDDFIVVVDNSGILGADKKATVLIATARLYDYIMREGLPIWLLPFSGVVKQYIIYVLVSNAIDWIVSKYQAGKWGRREIKPWEVKLTQCRRRK